MLGGGCARRKSARGTSRSISHRKSRLAHRIYRVIVGFVSLCTLIEFDEMLTSYPGLYPQKARYCPRIELTYSPCLEVFDCEGSCSVTPLPTHPLRNFLNPTQDIFSHHVDD